MEGPSFFAFFSSGLSSRTFSVSSFCLAGSSALTALISVLADFIFKLFFLFMDFVMDIIFLLFSDNFSFKLFLPFPPETSLLLVTREDSFPDILTRASLFSSFLDKTIFFFFPFKVIAEEVAVIFDLLGLYMVSADI